MAALKSPHVDCKLFSYGSKVTLGYYSIYPSIKSTGSLRRRKLPVVKALGRLTPTKVEGCGYSVRRVLAGLGAGGWEKRNCTRTR